MILVAYNPSVENLEKSYLTRDYSAGVTELVIRNSDRFNEDDRIMIGDMGAENTEIVTIDTAGVSADKTTLTLKAGTKFPHSASDPVYVMRYDQVRFYRSTTTVDGSYSVVATVDLDVDNAEEKTIYDDPTGLSSYFYKIAYYHSIDAVESELSDPMPGSGYTRKQVGTVVNDFLVEVGDLEQEYITVPQIISLMNEVNEDIIGQSRRPYRFLRTSATLTIPADTDRIPLPEDLVKFDRMRYTREIATGDELSGTIQMISIQEMEYYQHQTNAIPSPLAVGMMFAAIDETTNELVIYPKSTTEQTDAIEIFYWSEFNVITSLADIVQTPVARIYKLFLIGRFYRIRAKKDDSFLSLADRYTNDYNTEIVKLQRAQKVDVGSPMSFLPDTRTQRGLRRRV